MRWLLLPLLLLLSAPALATQPNIIVLVLDDVTACWIGDYTTDFAGCTEAAGYVTPGIDSVADAGVMVTHMWASPTCSPFRATLFTGTFPEEHRVHRQIDVTQSQGRPGLQSARPNIVQALEAGGYNTFMSGKWHLAAAEWGDQRFTHPAEIGFDVASGMLVGQTDASATGTEGGGGYEDWEDCNFITGVCTTNTTYATTDVIDDAIAALTDAEPWFMYLPLPSPHTPYHEPPANLFLNESVCNITTAKEECYAHAVEAADTEIKRLLDNVDSADTIVIITADNGTQWAVASAGAVWQQGRCKGSVGECGLWVPLVVSGPGIGTGTADILVQAPDLHATILDLAGVDNEGENLDTGSLFPSSGGQDLMYRGQSFKGNLADPAGAAAPRSCIYADMWFQDQGATVKTQWHRAIRNTTHKLIHNLSPGQSYVEEFFLTSSLREVAPDDHLDLSGDDYVELTAKMALVNAQGGDPCR